jgi:acetyl esterase/lipase
MDPDTDISELRKRLTDAKKALTASALTGQSQVIEEDQQIPMRDGESITVRIYRAKSPLKGGSPIFVMYHGGGFCLGDLENETLLCRRWVEEFGGVTVNVDYRLAPEHVFPVPVHDSYDALKWVGSFWHKWKAYADN